MFFRFFAFFFFFSSRRRHTRSLRDWSSDVCSSDLADAHLGNPVLDGLRAIDFLPPGLRQTAAGAWITAWTAAAPRSRPVEALRIAQPLAHLAYAVRYQEFLDNIEPSEQVYHLDDPASVIRHAVASIVR